MCMTLEHGLCPTGRELFLKIRSHSLQRLHVWPEEENSIATPRTAQDHTVSQAGGPIV